MLVQLYNIVYRNKLQIKCTAHFYCLEKQRNNENISLKYYSFVYFLWFLLCKTDKRNHMDMTYAQFGIVKMLCLAYIFCPWHLIWK